MPKWSRRLVNGTEISEILFFAARSVGAAFDGQNGQYRYMGNNGPMQLEVPVISMPALLKP